MSFDLSFSPCRYVGGTEPRVNPFTRAMTEVPRNAPLTREEAAAVRKVLQTDEVVVAAPARRS